MAYQWAKNFTDVLKADGVVSSDTAPMRSHAAYLYSETIDNERSVLDRGVELYQSGKVNVLCCSASGPYRATPESPVSYEGFSNWQRYLDRHGVRKSDIIPVDPVITPWHAGAEAKSFINLSLENGWDRVLSVAPKFHSLRTFTNTVTWARKTKPLVRVYSVIGMSLPWHESALHSQGHVRALRIDLTEGEWDRMNRHYGNEYDLCSCEEVLEYLRKRDGV